MSLFSWKTLAVGAAMVAFASLFDFFLIGHHIKTLRALKTCKISSDALTTESLNKALREYSKHNHPDVVTGVTNRVCGTEETNEIRDSIHKHGAVSNVAWMLFKLNVPPSQVENTIMLFAMVVGATAWSMMMGCLRGGRVGRIGGGRMPTWWTRFLVFVGLTQQGETATASQERQLMKKIKHAEFVYGSPPCSTHCGEIPSQCTATGWVYKDRLSNHSHHVVE